MYSTYTCGELFKHSIAQFDYWEVQISRTVFWLWLVQNIILTSWNCWSEWWRTRDLFVRDLWWKFITLLASGCSDMALKQLVICNYSRSAVVCLKSRLPPPPICRRFRPNYRYLKCHFTLSEFWFKISVITFWLGRISAWQIIIPVHI